MYMYKNCVRMCKTERECVCTAEILFEGSNSYFNDECVTIPWRSRSLHQIWRKSNYKVKEKLQLIWGEECHFVYVSCYWEKSLLKCRPFFNFCDRIFQFPVVHFPAKDKCFTHAHTHEKIFWISLSITIKCYHNERLAKQVCYPSLTNRDVLINENRSLNRIWYLICALLSGFTLHRIVCKNSYSDLNVNGFFFSGGGGCSFSFFLFKRQHDLNWKSLRV